jgi:hypothetical protein
VFACNENASQAKNESKRVCSAARIYADTRFLVRDYAANRFLPPVICKAGVETPGTPNACGPIEQIHLPSDLISTVVCMFVLLRVCTRGIYLRCALFAARDAPLTYK